MPSIYINKRYELIVKLGFAWFNLYGIDKKTKSHSHGCNSPSYCSCFKLICFPQLSKALEKEK